MNRTRRRLGGALLLTAVVAAGACGREARLPTSAVVQAAAIPLAAAADDGFSGTVPVDAANGSGGIPLNTYADWTLVEITVSGLLTQHHNTLGSDLQFGPLGLPNCSAGYTIVYGGDLAVLFPCPISGSPEVSVTRTVVVRGVGRADRSAGPTSCSGFPDPCFTYSGSQTITVSPVPVTVGVRGDFTQAPVGSTVTFTSTIAPATLGFGGWWFFMDNGFTYQACPSSNRATCAMQLFGPGRMEIYANAGAMERSGSWRVDVGPAIPTDTSGGGSGGGGGGGGQQGTLRLACVPQAPLRGQIVSCTATMSDGSSFALAQIRSTTPSGALTIVDSAITFSGTSYTWAGAAITGTHVVVSGANGSASADFTVSPRTFPDANPLPFIPTFATRGPPLKAYPGLVETSAGVQTVRGGLGFTQTSFFDYEPTRVTGGPNDAMVYITRFVWVDGIANGVTLMAGVHLNVSMFPGDPFYALQNGNGGRCGPSTVDGLRSAVYEHEQIHYTRHRALRRDLQVVPVYEAMTAYDRAPRISARTKILMNQPFSQYYRQQDLDDDEVDGNPATAFFFSTSCEWRFP